MKLINFQEVLVFPSILGHLVVVFEDEIVAQRIALGNNINEI